jgi:CHAT domain-containing protein
VLAIVNPTGDLAYAEVEGEQLARLFGEPHTQILLNDEATAAALKKRRASYLHFSCHGFYRWDDPLQSGLILARGEPFTLAQVLGELKLDTCRLVALSACETGITEVRQSSDEYLGLPAGFLQAGAPAVLSTLWPVNDLSTMLLIERFYQRHLQAGEDFPSALRHAQRWLRSVTAGEPTQRPFAHPYYWAAFTFAGA